ncbi:LexA family protein [Catalinimonas niigatensis]|uniref:LexA family protein n=1 Tax=Catalinimonas niigatensis TaxID=1397264 RepID=UPI002665F730|nr:translesion error-prone DNA polymerase V autoproteolytic subunit [Catalinimonas niigatensis]WPP51780.1 translesion error-prone DNA polymerase V autoproteolytic subunit [Catalinimonas niigatensis]
MLEIYRPSFETVLYLPLYTDKVSAGFPSPASDYEEERIDLNQALIARPSSTYMVRAQGNSMVGAGIFDHDLLVVDRSLTAKDGSVVIAVVHGDLTVKRLRIRNEVGRGRTVVLAAENPDYPDIHVQSEDSMIWGVVCYAVRDLLK